MSDLPSQNHSISAHQQNYYATAHRPGNQYQHNASHTTQDGVTTRQRTTIACTECRRKTRCSGHETLDHGKCKSCIKNGRDCIFVLASGSGLPFVPVNIVRGEDGRALQLYGAYRQLFMSAGRSTAHVASQHHCQDSTTPGGQQYYYTPPACFPPLQNHYTYATSPPISPLLSARVPSGTPPALPNPCDFTLPPINDLVTETLKGPRWSDSPVLDFW